MKCRHPLKREVTRYLILVLDEIEKQVKQIQAEEGEEVEEILLDEIEFKHFTEKIMKKLGGPL